MKKTARYAAAQALLRVDQGGAYSNIVIDAAIQDGELSRQEAGFATALFYGVLERRITLDHCISKFSKTPLRKLDPQVLTVLRLTLYQLLEMDGVPESAAVNEGAKLVRAMGKSSAAGFVNGLCRSFIRAGKTIPGLEEVSGDKALSLRYSCPQWLVRMLAASCPAEQLEQVLASSLGRPPVYLRVNTLRCTPQELSDELAERGVRVWQDQVLPGCLRVEETGDVTRMRSYRKGWFHVQDRASQLCAASLMAEPGQSLLDVCASPGGKTFTAAELMEGRGRVVSCDLTENRVSLIADGAKRLGLDCVEPTVADASVFDGERGTFDRVLCDVPCSGLGIIRRKPEIKYKDPAEFEALPALQYKILETSANYVKAGGRLVYSTCTLREEENRQVVERFLREHEDFEPAALPKELGTDSCHVTLLPGQNGADGFFISAIRRKG